MGGVAWPSSCSRNAHDKNVLVRRAQSRIDQATLESEIGDWEDARSWDHPSHPLLSDSSLRPCLGQGASWRAGVGRVRNLALLNILLRQLKLHHAPA
jgi:hypothetical protein